MQADEWLKLVLVVAIPLAIATFVTLWSIKQVAYRPKKRTWTPPRPAASDEATAAGAEAGERERTGGSSGPGAG